MIVARKSTESRLKNCSKLLVICTMKSLWASVQNNPVLFKKINGWLTVLWVVAIPASYVAGLLDSVVYVSALSLYAIVTGHLSTYQAARVEERQEIEAQKRDDHAPIRIEKKIEDLHQKVK